MALPSRNSSSQHGLGCGTSSFPRTTYGGSAGKCSRRSKAAKSTIRISSAGPNPEDVHSEACSRSTSARTMTCGCGSGRKFKNCCKDVGVKLRPSWLELSIRERNLIHGRALIDILGLDKGKTWNDARKHLTDEKIAKHTPSSKCFGPWTPTSSRYSRSPTAGRERYTPASSTRRWCGVGRRRHAVFWRDPRPEPIPAPQTMRPEYSPTKISAPVPSEFLKSALTVMELGAVDRPRLDQPFPRPGLLRPHLQSETTSMATSRLRSGSQGRFRPDDGDHCGPQRRTKKRTILYRMPEDSQRARILETHAGTSRPTVSKRCCGPSSARRRRTRLPSCNPANEPGKDGGEMMHTSKDGAQLRNQHYFSLKPQGPSSSRISRVRWMELLMAHRQQPNPHRRTSQRLQGRARRSNRGFIRSPAMTFFDLCHDDRARVFQALVQDVYTYLHQLPTRGRPHRERLFSDRFKSANAGVHRMLRKTGAPLIPGRMRPLIPRGRPASSQRQPYAPHIRRRQLS